MSDPSMARQVRPEVLAPAGDEECLRAAVRAGADAVYFGLRGFNARARASNFDEDALARALEELHAHGVKGYVTFNTLVFDHELEAAERAIRAIALAGADAIIVQDLGIARLAQAIAPTLPIHASTQMTCSDASAIELARELGASRVVLPRELSLADIRAIRAATDVELEVFVHGALCVSYSGQCLTSEAIGGRSANRGACAQACRLPYSLIVDGVEKALGDRAYLLSPGDLEASALVPQLAELGIHALKIEGRLKGPEYVAATTRLYRWAVDAVAGEERRGRELLRAALLTYTRGSGTGFLEGVDHQRLVEGRTAEHRGLWIGSVSGAGTRRGRPTLRVKLAEAVRRGDGIMVEGGHSSDGELGGRIWTLSREATELEVATAGMEVELWLGPDRDLSGVQPGRRVFKTSEPALEREILSILERDPHREPLDLVIRGAFQEPFQLSATTGRGRSAVVTGDCTVERADGLGLDLELLRSKLGRLGDSPFVLRAITSELPEGALVPPSSLNRARRALVERLREASRRSHATTVARSRDLLDEPSLRKDPPPPGLFVLCRTFAQAEAALAAGADGIYLDFLELTGTSRALLELRARGARFVGVAPPRIRKPKEEPIDRHLASLVPDAVLVRGLGALREVRSTRTHLPSPLFVGDFSLNVTNQLSARAVLARSLDAFTPAYDLDAAQLTRLLRSPPGAFAELVIHHPMPLFHTEHCLFAALLSSGRDHRSCGRPCEEHRISLRDRAQMEHPVEADVGCRNTVFHAAPQSAAAQVGEAERAGVRRFRIELVRELPEDVHRIVGTYRGLLERRITPSQVFTALSTEGGVGVVRGSLRVLS